MRSRKKSAGGCADALESHARPTRIASQCDARPPRWGVVLGVVAVSVLLLGSGCRQHDSQTSAGPSASPPSLDQIRALASEGQLDRAYEDLLEFRERLPKSEQSRDAFRLAAALYKQLYFRDRYANPEAPWVRDAPVPLFGWFESFLTEEDVDTFPQDDADVLFIGHHYGFVRQFETYANQSSVLSSWDFSFERDNGRVLSVTGQPVPRAQD